MKNKLKIALSVVLFIVCLLVGWTKLFEALVDLVLDSL